MTEKLEMGPIRTYSHGMAECVVKANDGAHHAILSRENSRSWWRIDLYDDGNIARAKKAFPKHYRTASAAFSALTEAYLDAKAGKRHPRFAGRTLAQEVNAVGRAYRQAQAWFRGVG